MNLDLGGEKYLEKLFATDDGALEAAGTVMKRMYDELPAASASQKNDNIDTPKSVKTKLYQHQRQALSWMKYRETQKPCGGLLGKNF